MNITHPCLGRLQNGLADHFKDKLVSTGWTVSHEIPPPGMEGDITVNCFKIAKFLRSKPDEIADFVSAFLAADSDVISAAKVKAFVNVTLRPEALHGISAGNVASVIGSAVLPPGHRRKILVEYSSPNTNKPLHLGHLRNNTLGLAVSSILKKAGHAVSTVNLVNDRGIHICKSMIAYQRFGGVATPESAGVKGDHFVGDFYVKFAQEFARQLADLKEKRPDLKDGSEDDLFLETEIGRAAQEMLRDWEAGKPEVVELWKKMNRWVLDGFSQTYKRMGVSFDKVYFESETYLLGKDIVGKGLADGSFTKNADGAVIADLEDVKLGTKVVLRSDGTSVYITQDLGTTLKKYEDFRPQSQIWIVGDEQNLHFKILFAILKKLAYPWADSLFHLSYGMVNLPSGRMKSREGTVVDADDLFDELAALARQAAVERYGQDMPADIDARAETIAMGALKFMLLKFNPKTTMIFDPGASVKFEGDTGPYVQYACARINSIERKWNAEKAGDPAMPPDWSLLKEKEEKELSVRMLEYPSVIRDAAERLDPSGLVNYLLELAKTFSRFYKQHSVMNAETEALRNSRFHLCLAVRDILADGLKTLTIDVPEAM